MDETPAEKARAAGSPPADDPDDAAAGKATESAELAAAVMATPEKGFRAPVRTADVSSWTVVREVQRWQAAYHEQVRAGTVENARLQLLEADKSTRCLLFGIGSAVAQFQLQLPEDYHFSRPAAIGVTSKDASLERLVASMTEAVGDGTFLPKLLSHAVASFEKLCGSQDRRDSLVRKLASPELRASAPPSPALLPAISLARQSTVDGFRRAWSLDEDDDSWGVHAARDRIEKELVAAFNLDSAPKGFLVDLVDGNPFVWKVTMFGFPEESALAKDLREHARRFGTREELVVHIKFPAEYPSTAPLVRLVRPILKPFTGNVAMGAFIIPHLAPEGWQEELDMVTLITVLRDCLIKHDARVELDTDAEYPVDTFKAAQERFTARDSDIETENDFKEIYSVYSASFAQRELDVSLPSTFEKGNKIIMPGEALRTMDMYGQSHDDGDWVGSSGLTFEITTPIGMRSFCGVMQFTAPESDMIILPDWMMKSLYVGEGMEVRFRAVLLPKLASVVVRPLEKKFLDIDVPQKTFLETALTNYTTLARGDVMSLSAFGHEIPFQVVGMKPDVPACALWSGFYADLPIDFLRPLTYREEEKKAAGSDGDGVAAPPLRRQTTDERAAAREERSRRMKEAFDKAEADRRAAEEQVRREEEGIPLAFYDDSKRTVRVRLRLFSGKSITLLCNPDTAVQAVEEYAEEACPSDGLPMALWVPSKTEPLDALDSVGDVAMGARIEQRVIPATECDACKRDGGEPTLPLATFVLQRERLGLCSAHRCEWLETLLQLEQVEAEDEALLSKTFVLNNLQATLV
eukprot:PLAT15547.1.p1 GENE.PLAT15547.1~~PLAT15547.1.p1  ORF type:complete len:806 (-),score=325.31 PLAT15547.1:38-2455(-)